MTSSRRWRAVGGTALAVLAIVVALPVIFRQAIARAAIAGAVAWTTGLHLSFGSLDVHLNHLAARDVHVANSGGETIADVGGLALEYSLRDLLPGGTHAFGLTGFDVERSHVVIVRHADGTLNVPLPKAQRGGGALPAFVFAGRVREASLDVYDFTQPAGNRHVAIAGAYADMNVDAAARSRYRAGLTLVQDGLSYPLSGSGDVDVTKGFGLQEWRAARVPIARLVNIALDTPQLRLSEGWLRDVDARVVSLPARDGSLVHHLSAIAQIERGRILLAGLARPVSDVRGRVAVYGNGLLLDGVNASLAGLPLHFDGGIFDLRSPHVQLTMTMHGDFRALRSVLSQTARMPLSGPMHLDVTAEGAATKPLVEIALRSPQSNVGPIGVSSTNAQLAFDGRNLDVVNFVTHHLGVTAVARGRLGTGRQHNAVEMLAGFDASSSSLPYINRLLPAMPLHGVAIATGDSPSLTTAQGILYGARGSTTMSGIFNLRSDGVGSVGPLRIEGPGESLYAIVKARGGVARVAGVVAAGTTMADLRGNVSNLGRGTPRYDLWTDIQSADLTSLVAMVRPSAAGLIEGSANAHVHVMGVGAAPSLAGSATLPEGAVNGLAFHELHATFAGTRAALALRDGNVGIGSSDVAFAADATPSSQRLTVVAPHADLADFNDFFDAGDMFGGKGDVRADVAVAGGSLAATDGNVALHDASLRGFDFGAADATWRGSADRIATTLALRGPFGQVWASGSLGLTGNVDMVARARDLDLSRWAAVAGITVPVAGLADADVSAAGRYPDLNATLNAHVSHADFARIPIDRFTIAASASRGRGRIAHAMLSIPHADASGSGTFGMRLGDRLDLAFHATSPNVAALATTVFRKTFDAAGSLDTTLHVRGTLANPAVADDFVLANARYRTLDVPRATGRILADERHVSVERAEIDLRKGRLLASASVPIRAMPFQIDPQNRPVSAALVADDVEASNIADLLPKGTSIAGRIDGRVDLRGSVRAPALEGQMTLAQGSFSGPQERVPITGATGALRFSGTTAHLENVHANAGGGTLSADGSASIPNVHDLSELAMAMTLHARSVRLDLPQYIKGRFDGDVALTRSPGSRPMLAGTLAIDSARIPMTALYNPKASNAQTPPIDLGIDMHVAVNRDVRVVSPNVDVGVEGSVRASGTVLHPQLAGTFDSTGGTVNFYRDFRVERAAVSFDPSSGIVPDVDATATTFITNPETNVALHVTGPATNLNVAFASDPSYDREQILGLLAGLQSVGAVRGVGATGGGSLSASSAITNMAAGQLDMVFTRNLLEPLSVALGGSLGLQNLQINTDVQGGLGLNAAKAFGKYVSFVFTDTFNEARRQSWSLDAHPSDRTQIEFTSYTSQNSNLLGFTPLLVQGLEMGSAATIPLDTGTNGIDVRIERKFP